MSDVPDPAAPRSVSWLAVAAVVVVAGLLRIPVLLTDFWFDEILSYERYARAAQSALDVFFDPQFKHDNNHHLNTLALYWLGDDRHWVAYRLPSAFAGLVAVAAAVFIGNRRSRLEGVLTGLLVAGCSLIVVYTTEARGYGTLLCFTTLGFLTLDRFLTSGSRRAMVAFWLSIAFGVASHPGILHFYLGVLLWTGYRLRSRLRDLAWLHAGPAAWLLVWILAVVRGGAVGGGPPWTWEQIIDRSLAWTFGYPLATIPAALGAVGVVALVSWDARRLWREGSDEGLFHVGAVLGPATLLAALAPPYLFPRYFMVSILFALVVSGRSLARLWRRSRTGRVTAAVLVILFMAGNGTHLATVARDRTGHYPAVVTRIVESRPGREVVVASPSLDQWSEMPLRFYERAMQLGNRIHFVPRADIARRAPDVPSIDWVIEPEEPCDSDPANPLTLRNGEVFLLQEAHRVCGPSGMSWFLYSPRP